MPTTEILTVELAPGTEAARVSEECGRTLTRQSGMQKLSFGSMVERPTHLRMLIDWDEIQSHNDFRASADYASFLKNFQSPEVVHVDFHGAFAAATSAPVTEVAFFVHDGEPPAECMRKAQQMSENIKKAGLKDVLGFAWGTTVEEIEREGVKGKAVVLAIGWPSIEAHVQFRDLPFFNENVDLLRNGEKMIDMNHTQFERYAA